MDGKPYLIMVTLARSFQKLARSFWLWHTATPIEQGQGHIQRSPKVPFILFLLHANHPSIPFRYDKVKILLKEIIKCQYVACMNPTAGSFNITPRMQRQFMTLAVQMPPPEIVRSIYFQVRSM